MIKINEEECGLFLKALKSWINNLKTYQDVQERTSHKPLQSKLDKRKKYERIAERLEADLARPKIGRKMK